MTVSSGVITEDHDGQQRKRVCQPVHHDRRRGQPAAFLPIFGSYVPSIPVTNARLAATPARRPSRSRTPGAGRARSLQAIMSGSFAATVTGTTTSGSAIVTGISSAAVHAGRAIDLRHRGSPRAPRSEAGQQRHAESRSRLTRRRPVARHRGPRHVHLLGPGWMAHRHDGRPDPGRPPGRHGRGDTATGPASERVRPPAWPRSPPPPRCWPGRAWASSRWRVLGEHLHGPEPDATGRRPWAVRAAAPSRSTRTATP